MKTLTKAEKIELLKEFIADNQPCPYDIETALKYYELLEDDLNENTTLDTGDDS